MHDVLPPTPSRKKTRTQKSKIKRHCKTSAALSPVVFLVITQNKVKTSRVCKRTAIAVPKKHRMVDSMYTDV